MPVAQILHNIAKFYTTEVRLKYPNAENDWANYALSYVQYFTGKEIIQYQDGKIERVNPKTVEEKYPWIPSAIKSTVYFCLMIPCAIIGIFFGTIARALSLDSKEVTDAIFSDRESLPPRKKPIQRASLKHIRPKSTQKAELKASDKVQVPPKKSTDDLPPSAPNEARSTSDFVWDYLKSFRDGVKDAAAAPFQAMQEKCLESFKIAMEDRMSQMLGILLTFDEELLKHARNPGANTPNYAAIIAFIETQRKDENYQAPFYLRDHFVMSLSTITMMGVKLNSEDIAQWEDLDAQCQVLMNAPELKSYLDEPPPVDMQDELTYVSAAMKSQALDMKVRTQDIMRSHSVFFNQLLEQLNKNPMDRSAILLLLNAKKGESFLGAEAFTIASVFKAQLRILKNFYDEPLFSNYIKLYTSCFLQLYTAKFTIPTLNNPLCKDLSERTAPAALAPSSATPAAEPAVASDLQNTAPFTVLLQSAISFSEEFLQQKNVDAMKIFMENNRKAPAKYKSPFSTRCYVIFTLRTLIEENASLNPTDIARWKTLDTQLEIVMQNPKLKAYLDEPAPEFKSLNSTLLAQIRTSFVQNRATYEHNIQDNILVFQVLLATLAQTPLDQDAIKSILYHTEQAQIANLFFGAKSLLAARGFAKDLFVGELYENYFNAYIACITRLHNLNFEIPFFSMSPPPAEPKKATPAPSTPALTSQQIARINQELKAVTDFYVELLAMPPGGTSEWLGAQKSKPDYCYPFHWSKTHAETLKTHRDRFDQKLMATWEKLHPKCIIRLQDNSLNAYLDESPGQ